MMRSDGFRGTSRFEVRARVGSGGFGTVYKAWDREHEQVVALKHLHRSDPAALRRFKQEFRSLANVTHAHLVSLFELHQADLEWFFTMEFVDGSTFAEWLRPAAPVPEAHLPSVVMDRPRPPLSVVAAPPPVSAIGPRTDDETATPSEALQLLAANRKPLAQPLAARPLEQELAPSTHPSSGGSTRSRSGTTTGTSKVLERAQPFFGIEIPDDATRALWEATRPTAGKGAPDPERVRAVFAQLVEAVAWLHASGHLHRDVKPSNVLVNPQGLVKVLDFGLVTRLFTADASAPDTLLGTPVYMAPELCAGLPASPASDWYSVGAMLYLVLTGQLPFVGDLAQVVLAKQAIAPRPPSELAPVPKDLEELCLALLATNPVERPEGHALLAGIGRRAQPRLGRGPTASFIGRRDELTALAATLCGRDEGRNIALVEGLSGYGKSALVEHVLRGFDGGLEPDVAASMGIETDASTLVLRSRCYERGSVAYRALDGAVDDLALWLTTLPADEVERLLPADAAERHALARLFPVLPIAAHDDAAGAKAAADASRADPTELKWRAFAGLKKLVSAAARRCVAARPPGASASAPGLVLSIDDAHWADEDSLAPIAELMRGVPPALMGWVLAYRSDEKAASPFLRALDETVLQALEARVRTIAIGPLAPEDAVALAAERLGGNLDEARAIVREAEGSPLFITELSYLDPRRGELGGANDDGPRTALSLVELLAARVQELPTAARNALELIAVAGEPVPVRLVRAATGADQRDLNRLVQEHLVAARAVGHGVERVMTWHDRVRETVRARLAPAERARRHRALAETAEAQGEADALFLFTHWRDAGEVERARPHGMRAAEAASSAFAFDRAVEIYRALLGPAGAAAPPELHATLADALKNAGRGIDAAKSYLDAALLTREPIAARRLEIRAAEQYMFAGAFGQGEAVIRKVLDRVGLSAAQGVLGALSSFALETLRNRVRGLDFQVRDASQLQEEELALIDTLWSVTIGLSMAQPLASQAIQQRHLRAALDAGEPLRIARALSVELAFSGMGGGRKEGRSELLSKVTHDVASTIAHPYPRAFATMSDGATHWLRGRWPEAQRALDDAAAVFERECAGVTWEKDTSNIVALAALAHQGDFNELAARYEHMLVDAIDRGDLYMEVQLRTRVTPLLDLLAGRPGEARTAIAHALGRWTDASYQIPHYWGFVHRVMTYLYEGDGEAAWREVLAGASPLEKSFLLLGQYYRVQYHALVAKAALAARVGATPRTAKVLDARIAKVARRMVKEDMPWTLPKARLFEALALPPKERMRASALAREAALGFGEAAMHGHRVAAERVAAELAGDAAGVSAAEDALRARGARDPRAFARTFTGV